MWQLILDADKVNVLHERLGDIWIWFTWCKILILTEMLIKDDSFGSKHFLCLVELHFFRWLIPFLNSLISQFFIDLITILFIQCFARLWDKSKQDGIALHHYRNLICTPHAWCLMDWCEDQSISKMYLDKADLRLTSNKINLWFPLSKGQTIVLSHTVRDVRSAA